MEDQVAGFPPWDSDLLNEAFLDLFSPLQDDTASNILDPLPWWDFDTHLNPCSDPYGVETYSSYGTISPEPVVSGHVESYNTSLFQNAVGVSLPVGNESQELEKSAFPISNSPHSAYSDPAIQTYLYEFEGGPNIASSRRKRRRFSSDRKHEVHQMRKVGACIRCKITKSSCKLSSPCSSCVKACGDPRLGRSLCTRQSLLNMRFSMDLWGRDLDIAWLKREVQSLSGPTQTIHFFLGTRYATPNAFNSDGLASDIEIKRYYEEVEIPWGRARPLILSIQRFSSRKIGDDNCIPNTALISQADNHCANSEDFYAIPQESLPTLDEIETWAMCAVRSSPMNAGLGWFRSSFFHFARTYLYSSKSLPLKDLVEKAVRLSALHGVWREVLVHHSSQTHQNIFEGQKHYASLAVQVQLDIIIAKGIINLEIDLLSTLQKIIFSTKGPGKGNMLPVWTCLWLLILTYRDTIDAWDPQKHDDKASIQLSRQMYDMLVTIYSEIFRLSSPLRLNWLIADIYDLFGRDEFVMQDMGTLKTEFFLFDKFSGHRHTKDVLLRSLIFKREIKGMKTGVDPLSQRYYESSKEYYPLRVNDPNHSDPSVAYP